MTRRLILKIALVLSLSPVPTLVVFSQQPAPTEKQDLVMKFRRLTGADRVNMNIGMSLEDIRNDLVASVDNDKELTEAQKIELRKSALEAYDRLDKQLRGFLNDSTRIAPVSEAAIFGVYDQAFTETELKDLIEFFSTPTGQKAANFLPTLSAQTQKAFQAKLIPLVQEFITPMIKAEGDELKKKVQEAKLKKP